MPIRSIGLAGIKKRSSRSGIILLKNIEADIVVLDMPLLDTTQYKDSMGKYIRTWFYRFWMTEEERERIRKRQCKGIDLALQNGLQFGRQADCFCF